MLSLNHVLCSLVLDGGTLPDPKPPHRPHSYGSLSYASGSAKNSSTSQFFICLADSAEVRKKKLDGKYFPFGEIMEEDVDKLKAFERVLEQDEGGWADMRKAGGRCWIFDCGVC
jgi:cyclophilin family peptidyl-prolyl cis-trans isomerase